MFLIKAIATTVSPCLLEKLYSLLEEYHNNIQTLSVLTMFSDLKIESKPDASIESLFQSSRISSRQRSNPGQICKTLFTHCSCIRHLLDDVAAGLRRLIKKQRFVEVTNFRQVCTRELMLTCCIYMSLGHGKGFHIQVPLVL